jgi:hypothetical protein
VTRGTSLSTIVSVKPDPSAHCSPLRIEVTLHAFFAGEICEVPTDAPIFLVNPGPRDLNEPLNLAAFDA